MTSPLPRPLRPSLRPSPAQSLPPAISIPTRFRDLQGHWAAPYVEALASRNLIKGYGDGTYRPDEAINRAQFAALVAASYGTIPFSKAAVAFVDVPPTLWAASAINLAQQRGFVGGYPDQTYRPDQAMARVQAMVAVATGLKLPAAPANALGIFRDRAQIPSYAIDALATATQQGLVVNYPDPALLRPLEPITRAEVAVLIYQGLVALEQAPSLDSGNASTPPVVVQPRTTQGSFPDIQNHWAKDFVQGLLNENLIRGYDDGQFYPDRPMTRAQFAALLDKAFTLTPRRPGLQFRDVPPNYWGASAIQAAYRAGYLSGFPDQTFGPENSMVRAQSWVALVNGVPLMPNQTGNLTLLNRYSDRDKIPAYALDAVAKAPDWAWWSTSPMPASLTPAGWPAGPIFRQWYTKPWCCSRACPPINSPYIVRP
ncbi:MAG: S-layer homology domain-containing protein [Leptolyngbyaceae cyanobacterium SM2_3_12]|nr:S-layer homology domain-containing protein [Leptolyngbyaceae cyanobacterium SM2_3_12]